MDLSFGVNFHMRRRNNLRREWKDLGARQNNPVETHLHPSLAHKVPWVFIILEMAAELRATREERAPKSGDMTKIAKHGIADLRGLGREVRFRNGALQERPGGNDLIASLG